MKFAELHIGDWFEWDKRVCIRLKNMIMSLNKRDFGALYTPIMENREVRYITTFDYDATAKIANFTKIKNLDANETPFTMLLKSSSGRFYVRISPYDPGDRDLVVISAPNDNQGTLVHSKYFINKFDVVEKVRVNMLEEEL